MDKEYTEKFIEVSNIYKKGYDFYVYFEVIDDILPEKYVIFTNYKTIIKESLKKKIVEDTFEIPKNIKIIENLEEVEDFKNFWSRKISIAKREYLKNNLKEKGIIFATKDILEIL